MKPPKLRILLADDHKMFREGLQLFIDAQPNMCVVGEAATGSEAVARAREFRPDIVVMDLSLPGLNGLQATERILHELPATKVIALSVYEDEGYLRQMCQAGAVGYVLKRSGGHELVEAIEQVAKGGVHFETSLASKALARQFCGSATKRSHGAALSDREREVLVQLAWGYSNKEIAIQLGLSVKTVEAYKVRVAGKLQLRSRTEMVRYALRQGWLTNEQPPENLRLNG
jgi:two-component system, NarL family, response regulator NreC